LMARKIPTGSFVGEMDRRVSWRYLVTAMVKSGLYNTLAAICSRRMRIRLVILD
jgi:hypothetical protein